MKINRFDSEKYCCTDESVKRQIADSTSENLTDSDSESKINEFIDRLNILLILLFPPEEFTDRISMSISLVHQSNFTDSQLKIYSCCH